MIKPQPPEGRRPSAALAALLFVALAACALSPQAGAQSGRRKPGSPPSPTTSGTSGSESKPETKKAPLLSLVVMSEVTASYDVDNYTRRIIEDGFASRLGGVPGLSLTRAGRGSRKDARDRAKNETEAYVVFLQVEDDSMGPSATRTSRDNSRMFILHTYIYAPKTGDLKFNDTTYQRNFRPSVGVGGVRLPVPSSGRRYPSEYELRQLSHDAADRVLSRLQITPPPDNR